MTRRRRRCSSGCAPPARPSSSPACGTLTNRRSSRLHRSAVAAFLHGELSPLASRSTSCAQRTSSAAGRLKRTCSRRAPSATWCARCAAPARENARTPGCCRATTIPSQHCPSCGATTSSRCCKTTPSSTSPRRRARARRRSRRGTPSWQPRTRGSQRSRSTRCAGRARCCSLGRSPLAARRRRTRGATSCCRSSTWRILTSAARSTPTCAFPPSAPTRCPPTCEGPSSKFARRSWRRATWRRARSFSSITASI